MEMLQQQEDEEEEKFDQAFELLQQVSCLLVPCYDKLELLFIWIDLNN